METVRFSVVLIGALDSKLCEYAFLAERLRAQHPTARLSCVDLSVLPLSAKDVDRRNDAFSSAQPLHIVSATYGVLCCFFVVVFVF
jgi:hypothetical protein